MRSQGSNPHWLHARQMTSLWYHGSLNVWQSKSCHAANDAKKNSFSQTTGFKDKGRVYQPRNVGSL